MLRIKNIKLLKELDDILSEEKQSLQINTINAHSYNVAQKDETFAQILLNSDFLLPDGQSVVWAKKKLSGEKLFRITGFDLFEWEMARLNKIAGKCFFLGSSEKTLSKIKEKVAIEYPSVSIEVYSPPFKECFSIQENDVMIQKVNSAAPDVLFVGMTAPKQEKWVAEHARKLKVNHICSIGAVFDFYAGNVKRAPFWMQSAGLEWLARLVREPRRMWRRYIIGNIIFIFYILKEKYKSV